MNEAVYVLATLKRQLAEMQSEEDGRYTYLYLGEVLAMIAAIEADAVLGDGVEV